MYLSRTNAQVWIAVCSLKEMRVRYAVQISPHFIHKCDAPDETSLLKPTRDSPGVGTGEQPMVQLPSQPSLALRGRICFGDEWKPRREQAGHQLHGTGENDFLKSQFSPVVFNVLL